MIIRTSEEIKELLEIAKQMEREGMTYNPDCTYEEGIINVIEWLTNSKQKPLIISNWNKRRVYTVKNE